MNFHGCGACEESRLSFAIAIVYLLVFAQQDPQVSKATDCDNDGK